VRNERRELELRKDGQLAELLGEALAREPSAELRRLASEDRKQAEEGLVALISNGKMYYKPVEELGRHPRGEPPVRVPCERSRSVDLQDSTGTSAMPGLTRRVSEWSLERSLFVHFLHRIRFERRTLPGGGMGVSLPLDAAGALAVS
jgi:hypothetical protein